LTNSGRNSRERKSRATLLAAPDLSRDDGVWLKRMKPILADPPGSLNALFPVMKVGGRQD